MNQKERIDKMEKILNNSIDYFSTEVMYKIPLISF